MSILEVRNVSHSFENGSRKLFRRGESDNRRQILKNVSFSVKKGEIVGLNGKNGVGKTTLIKIMSGLLAPEEGRVTIDSFRPIKEQKKLVKQMGVLLVKPSQLKQDVFVEEALEWNRLLFKTEHDVFYHSLSYYLELLELKSAMKCRVQNLSLGQVRKLELMDILLHNPKILLLDEPTIGVDVTAKETIRNCLLQLNQTQDLTVLLTSHDEGDMKNLCNRRLVLEDGQVAEG